jgi:hypothetical protein
MSKSIEENVNRMRNFVGAIGLRNVVWVLKEVVAEKANEAHDKRDIPSATAFRDMASDLARIWSGIDK